eukprot:scaffold63509_cov63-Phaeocystis_antarctica.AAC.4
MLRCVPVEAGASTRPACGPALSCNACPGPVRAPPRHRGPLPGAPDAPPGACARSGAGMLHEAPWSSETVTALPVTHWPAHLAECVASSSSNLPEASVTAVGLPSRTLALPATTARSDQVRPPSCEARLTMCTAYASRQLPWRASAKASSDPVAVCTTEGMR